MMPEIMMRLLIIMVASFGDPNAISPSAMAVLQAPPLPPPAAQAPPAQRPDIPRPATAAAGRRFIPFAVASTVFDSNINHDPQDLDSYGGVLGVGGIFRNDPRKPTLQVQYQAGLHRYTNTDQWDRLSHYARAAWDRRFNRRLALEMVGEVSIKGSSEDRELSNQALVSPRLEFRLTPGWRLRALGGWRVKRYEDTPDRNAFNRYAGLELARRPRSGPRWDAGAKYELNATESDRQRYLRWTWYGGVSIPVRPIDRLDLDMRYLRQRYPYRFVNVPHGPDVLRRDWRVEPEVSWLHTVHDDVELRLGYAFSGRESNDPRRDYRSHQMIFSVQKRW